MRILSFFTKLLHFFPAEISHSIALNSLKLLHLLGILRYFAVPHPRKLSTQDSEIKELESFLHKFPNKIGIAAGLDKNGDFIDSLAGLGVGFIEIGTVTPKPQKGNDKPRLFRDKRSLALINRMGFNNKGVDYLVEKLKKRKSNIPLGISIGKNFDTSLNEAHEDYLHCLKRVYEYADYIAINISSPNTKDLRKLSSKDFFDFLLKEIKNCHSKLSKINGYKPIFVKISPDETPTNLKLICKSIVSNKMDGIICSNTTVNHDEKNGRGGLSGAPLKKVSNENLSFVRDQVGESFLVIASGGVMSIEDYQEKIKLGANLVQVYTGFIYEGPRLIKDILNNSSG